MSPSSVERSFSFSVLIERDKIVLLHTQIALNATLNKSFNLLKEDDLGFIYSGSFHDGLTARLIDLSETVLSRTNVTRAKRNKLAFAMVEAYQNIIRHKVSLPFYQEHPGSRPAFVVRSNANVQSLVAINAIPNSVKVVVEQRIHEINSMSKDELKKMFLSGLEGNSISEKGGAGLGLIEMARRSGNKLGCRMVPLGPEHSMFCLGVVIGDVSEQCVEEVLDSAIYFHEISIEENLLIMHKGELSASAVSALLPMVQRDMDDSPNKASVRSRAYLASVEVFRADRSGSDGIFALCKSNNNYLITVGREMNAQAIEKLNSSVRLVNEMSQEEVNAGFRRALLSQDLGDKELRGLYDLAICSQGHIETLIVDTDDSSFMSIQATV